MQLTETVSVAELAWVLVGIFGLFYGLLVVHDAVIDVRVRRSAGLNHGREQIAQLLVVTSSLLVYVFVIFLAAGGLSMTIPTPGVVRPAAHVIQAFFVSVEVALAFMLFYKHRVRRRVFNRELADQDLRAAAAVELARVELEHNTVALEANTAATEAATDAMQNGGLAAQLDATRAMDANTASRVSDAQALLVAAATLTAEHEDNTAALVDNSEATRENTDTRRDDQETTDG